VPKGEGKGWAKGKRAADDARVARAAAGHRGKSYQRQKPLNECGWAITAERMPTTWSPKIAYLVGLIATDGNLARETRTISFVSMDLQLVETFLALTGRPGRYRTEITRTGTTIYRVQFKDAQFHRWLLTIGLMPRESLVLGAIAVQDEFLAPLVRGLLDGDGTITNAVWRADTTRRSDYFWEWFGARFVSGSRLHLESLRGRLRGALGLRGWIAPQGKRSVFALAFGKHDSIRLLSRLYSDRDAPCLLRKRAIWDAYARRHEL